MNGPRARDAGTSGPQRAPRERLFFAIWPPPELRAALPAIARTRLAANPRAAARARVLAPAALHLTLAFLGSLDAGARRRAEAAGQAVAQQGLAPFVLHLERCGAWPGPAVLWSAPAHAPAPLLALVQALREVLARGGLPVEARAFRAHLTLARKVRAALPTSAHPALAMPVTAFHLVRSQTHPGGARYASVAAFALTGRAAGADARGDFQAVGPPGPVG